MAVASPRSNTAGWQFDQRIPAIVHPIVDRAPDGSASKGSAVDWIVVTLDMGVLQKRILPELAERYFGGPEELNYKLAVVTTGTSPGTIYSSDPEYGNHELGAADFTMNIFGYPAKRDFNGIRDPRAGASPPAAPDGLTPKDRFGFRSFKIAGDRMHGFWNSNIAPVLSSRL